MSEWSVAVTTCVPTGVEDVEDAVGEILDAVYDFAPAASFSSGEVTVQIAVSGADAVEAATRAIGVFTKAVESVGWPVDVREVHATEWSLFEARLEEPTLPEMVGITEIADLLGTSRQRASELARSPKFPAPLAELAAGPVWPKPAVERFVEEWDRRPGRPRSTV